MERNLPLSALSQTTVNEFNRIFYSLWNVNWMVAGWRLSSFAFYLVETISIQIRLNHTVLCCSRSYQAVNVLAVVTVRTTNIAINLPTPEGENEFCETTEKA